MDALSTEEKIVNSPRLDIRLLPRGSHVTFDLISVTPLVSESVSLHVISPRRRLLHEPSPIPIYAPLQAVLQRGISPQFQRLDIYDQAVITTSQSNEQVPALLAAEPRPGSPRRSNHVSLEQDPTMAIPYRNPIVSAQDGAQISPERLRIPELVDNEVFTAVQHFFNETSSKSTQQSDSKLIGCQDGQHHVKVGSSSQIYIGSSHNVQEYSIRRVVGDFLGETHYVVERSMRQEQPQGDPVVCRVAIVISNNPEYHGTHYATFSDVLNVSQDLNRVHDCTLEIPSVGTPQAIARFLEDQTLADEGAINTEVQTFTISGRVLQVPTLESQDVASYLKTIEESQQNVSHATPISRKGFFGRYLQRKGN